MLGDPITQPAQLDNGELPGDIVGQLTFAPPVVAWGDAAVARLNANRGFIPSILGSDVSIQKVGALSINMVVEKSGRSKGVTRGRIEGIGIYFYPAMLGGVNGFRVVPLTDDPTRFDLAAPGDSGAVYYDVTANGGIGLHCAGGTDDVLGEVGVACTLSTVLTVLKVSLHP